MYAEAIQDLPLKFFIKLVADQVLVFDWIAGSNQVNLL